jgi:ADP-ribosyltransferase exoenzyme
MSKSFDELSKINAEAFEKVDKERQKFKYAFGPLNKDKATIELEKIFNDLVEDSTKQDKSVKITLENGQLFYQKGTSDKVNLTDILSKANLTHLNIDPAIIETYSKIPAIHDNPVTKVVKAGNVVQKEATKALTEEEFKVKINRATPEQKEYLKELSYGECLAIYRYTSPEYAKINGLMRGDYRSLKKLRELEEEKVKSTLMHTIVASSALNKVPDIDLPTVTRRQGDFGIDQMIENVKNNMVTQEKAFISTSFEDHDSFKKTYPNQIILKNVQGKDISAISYFGKEKEYLISPSTQLKWTGHTIDGENHIFTVEGSNALLDQRMKKNATSLTTSERVNRKAAKIVYNAKDKTKDVAEQLIATPKKLKLAKEDMQQRAYEAVSNAKGKASYLNSNYQTEPGKLGAVKAKLRNKAFGVVDTSLGKLKNALKDPDNLSYEIPYAEKQHYKRMKNASSTAVSMPNSSSQQLAKKAIVEDASEDRRIDKLEIIRTMPNPKSEAMVSTSVTSVEDTQKDKRQTSIGAEREVNQAEWEGTRQILPTKKSQINIGEHRIDSGLIDKEDGLMQPQSSPKIQSPMEKPDITGSKLTSEERVEDRMMPPDSPRVMSVLSTSATSVEDTQKDKLGEHRIDSRLIDAAHNIEHMLEDKGLVSHKSHEMEARPVFPRFHQRSLRLLIP